MKAKYSVSTLWDSRAVNDKKESRIMLSVSINRQRFLVSIKLYCTLSDYNKVLSGRSLSEPQKILRQQMQHLLSKAEDTLSRLNEPTKETFLKFFKSDANLSNGSKVDAYALYKVKYEALMKEGRFGSAHNVRCSWYSVRSFRKELFLEDIDEPFLKSYRTYMLKKGSGNTTIGIYLRNLRSVYNQAVNDGLISGNAKPFKNVVIGSSVKSKAVVYPEQLGMLWNYKTESIREQRAIAFFFFCYMANGMNFKDVGHLKFKNIQGDVLSYVREKTKRTKMNATEIKIYLHDAMKKIIAVWGNKDRKPDNYIFPLMPKYKSDLHMDKTIVRYKRVSNKMLAKIGRELGFSVHLCLNLARHSYATKQKIDGTPVAFISDAMGHSSMAVTEHYLKSLPDENLKALNAKLLNFK
ncbi:MAG: site-specific integrase [Ferruginibacter sp.]